MKKQLAHYSNLKVLGEWVEMQGAKKEGRVPASLIGKKTLWKLSDSAVCNTPVTYVFK